MKLDGAGQGCIYGQRLKRINLGDVVTVDIDIVLMRLNDYKLVLVPSNMPRNVPHA